jgi:septal ring factor EnvC (AmiA/AmiB activator)
VEPEAPRRDARRKSTRTSTSAQKEQQRLNTLAAQKKQSVTKIQGERKEYEAAAAELERTARRIQALLAELGEEAPRGGGSAPPRRAGHARAARPAAPPPLPPYEGEFAKAQGKLDWPLRGEIVGRFGTRSIRASAPSRSTTAIDIKASPGETIRSVAKGRVDFVSNDYGSYGEMLILNHGSGTTRCTPTARTSWCARGAGGRRGAGDRARRATPAL